MLEEVIVEGIRRHSLKIRRIVAGPAVLDGSAVGPTGPARPIQRWLQGGVLGIVLGHAPQLRRRPSAALGRTHGADEWEQRKEETDGEAPIIHLRELDGMEVTKVNGLEVSANINVV